MMDADSLRSIVWLFDLLWPHLLFSILKNALMVVMVVTAIIFRLFMTFWV